MKTTGAEVAASMFELQLGQLCNDRCVFCISGRITRAGEARLLPLEPLAARLRQARAEGRSALTFLGGEPTIQPHFLALTQLAVALGFSPIVVFTNGSKAGRTDLIDRVIETGGRFEWRFSFQGATEEAHERTTERKGSWGQLIEAVARASARGQRISVNTCVVAQNHESLGSFGQTLAPFDVAQLHVDMIHPEDTGDLSLEELRPMMVRYTEVAPHLRAMIAALPAGFDVNVGNVPPCIAPDLSPWIHHGGPPTETSQVSDFGLPVLQPSRDKYTFKERKKLKVQGCARCVFDRRCSGLFPEYAAIYGTEELSPIEAEASPFDPVVIEAVRCALDEVGGRLLPDGASVEVDDARLVLLAPGAGDAHAGYDRASIRALSPSASSARALERFDAALRQAGFRTVHPPGDDARLPAPPRIAAALARWRRAAPFGPLTWEHTRIRDGALSVGLVSGACRFEAWVDERGSGYRVLGEAATSPAIEGALRKLASSLRAQ